MADFGTLETKKSSTTHTKDFIGVRKAPKASYFKEKTNVWLSYLGPISSSGFPKYNMILKFS